MKGELLKKPCFAFKEQTVPVSGTEYFYLTIPNGNLANMRLLAYITGTAGETLTLTISQSADGINWTAATMSSQNVVLSVGGAVNNSGFALYSPYIRIKAADTSGTHDKILTCGLYFCD